MADKKAERIQTSILNGVEKKALVWLAERQPKWVVSDTLTAIGTLGAIMIGAGYILCSVNAHLKSEFRLTYAKLGPTEFRVIAIILTSLFIFIEPLREFSTVVSIFGKDIDLRALDVAGLVILALLVIIYLVTIISDAKGYAKMDPMPKREDK